MYQVVKTNCKTKNEPKFIYSVANENRIFCDITDDEETARKFVELLNDNDVDEVHVLDVIEDFFYG